MMRSSSGDPRYDRFQERVEVGVEESKAVDNDRFIYPHKVVAEERQGRE